MTAETLLLSLISLGLVALSIWLTLELRSTRKAARQVTADEQLLLERLAHQDAALHEAHALRTRREAIVHRLETQLERSLEFSGMAAWTWNPIENVVHWNGPVDAVFGVKPELLNSYEALLQMVIPEDRDRLASAIQDSRVPDAAYTAEFRIQRPDGQIRWIAGLGRTITYHGKPVQMSGVNFDITERKEAESRLRESEQHFRLLTDALPQMIWIANSSGRTEYRNRQWELTSGFTVTDDDDLLHRLLHPEDLAAWRSRWGAAVREAKTYEQEMRLWDARRGEYRWFLSRAQKSDEPVGRDRWFGTLTDIHERKLAEAGLLKSQQDLLDRERQLAMLFESGLMGDFTWDTRTDIVRLHPTIWRIYGELAPKQEDTVSAFWFRSRQHPEDLPFIERESTAMLRGERPLNVEFRVIWPDGSVHWLYCRASVTKYIDGEPAIISGINIDITERKNAALEIAKSEQEFRALADSVPLIVSISEDDGTITYINQRWFQVTGQNPSSVPDWKSALHPDDLEYYSSLRGSARRSGKPFEAEIRLWSAPLGEYRWYLARSVPVRDGAGRIQRWVSCGAETHQQKSMQEMLEAQVMLRTDELRQSLREKETLLKEIHHRVKNNLQIVSSLLKMQTDTLKDQAAQVALSESRQRVYSMALIHERLYGTDHMDEIDFADYAEGLVNDLRYSSGRMQEVDIRISAAQIFLNVEQAIPCGLILNELVTNALKYAYPPGQTGEVLITLAEQADKMVWLTVADHGIGLPADFDIQRCDSLGLSIVEVLSRQIGGRLEIKTANGASFSVVFPMPEKPAPVRSSAA